MSDQPTTDAPATDAPADTDQQPDAQPKPTETVEFWKQKAREQEKRAKENATAATELAGIRDAQKSESQKAAERIQFLEAGLSAAQGDTLRFKVASKYGIDDEDVALFLTGSNEETLTKQAERLAGRSDGRKQKGNHVPREGSTPHSAESEERETARAIFGAP